MTRKFIPIRLIVLLIFLAVSHNSPAQEIQKVFKAGETIFYDVAYNWGFIWVDAGKVKFSVDSLVIDGRPVYHFKSSGRSLKIYDWIFKVRDYYESYADAVSFEPVYFRRNTYEGGYFVKNEYNFDYENKKIFSHTENSDKPETYDTLNLLPGIKDVQTAVYFARSINFSDKKIGEKFYFSMIIDNEVYNIYARYLGKEIVENIDGRIYRCHKFSAMLVEGTIFKGGEDLLVWATDDKNQIPVIVEAKIIVGSVKAYLVNTKNLFHKTTSIINR